MSNTTFKIMVVNSGNNLSARLIFKLSVSVRGRRINDEDNRAQREVSSGCHTDLYFIFASGLDQISRQFMLFTSR